MYDVIPDIHGMADKLAHRLTALGYRETRGAWRHSDPGRRAVFLGDFIDRGPENGRVLSIVRAMMEAGTARAVMGNHELNAIHFHNSGKGDRPLRAHSQKNIEQHGSFLAEFPLGSRAARDWTRWMAGLPLWLELDGLRFVHACWDDAAIAALMPHSEGGVLREDALLAAAADRPLNRPVETLTKGPEAKLPEGVTFRDKNEHERDALRLRWWLRGETRWRALGISVPNPSQLPEGDLPEAQRRPGYASDAPPVFFGHYWLEGAPEIQAPNVLCLDYSAGMDGPLVSYRVAPGAEELEPHGLDGLAGC